jgi:hypothetical protein
VLSTEKQHVASPGGVAALAALAQNHYMQWQASAKLGPVSFFVVDELQ